MRILIGMIIGGLGAAHFPEVAAWFEGIYTHTIAITDAVIEGARGWL